MDIKGQKKSTNQDTFYAKKVEKTAKPRREQYSVFVGSVIPDPRVVGATSARIKNFSKDMKSMTMKNFGYTGDLFYRPGY